MSAKNLIDVIEHELHSMALHVLSLGTQCALKTQR